MAEHFDELTKALASGVSRRDALTRFVGGLFGGLLAAVGLGKTAGAQAAGTCPAYCRSIGLTPGGGNAFGKCVSNCAKCRDAGGTECGATGCCQGTDVCTNPSNGTCTATCSNVFECDPAEFCGANCGCVPTTEGFGFCHQGSSCNALPACVTSATCPAGWFCAETCCVGLKCVPPCGTAATASEGDGPRSIP